jgi:hypothetical protein
MFSLGMVVSPFFYKEGLTAILKESQRVYFLAINQAFSIVKEQS